MGVEPLVVQSNLASVCTVQIQRKCKHMHTEQANI